MDLLSCALIFWLACLLIGFAVNQIRRWFR
jgi:hypothetical protein